MLWRHTIRYKICIARGRGFQVNIAGYWVWEYGMQMFARGTIGLEETSLLTNEIEYVYSPTVRWHIYVYRVAVCFGCWLEMCRCDSEYEKNGEWIFFYSVVDAL